MGLVSFGHSLDLIVYAMIEKLQDSCRCKSMLAERSGNASKNKLMQTRTNWFDFWERARTALRFNRRRHIDLVKWRGEGGVNVGMGLTNKYRFFSFPPHQYSLHSKELWSKNIWMEIEDSTSGIPGVWTWIVAFRAACRRKRTNSKSPTKRLVNIYGQSN